MRFKSSALHFLKNPQKVKGVNMNKESKTKKTQTSEVIKYLRKHPKSGLTQITATEKFGATRLSGIINRLRKRGMDIETVMKPVRNRYGDITKVGYYILHE